MDSYQDNDYYDAPAAEKVKGVADIVFLVDATGSMKPCMNDIKNNIRLFFHILSSEDENGGRTVHDWRAKVCGYRDYFDNEETAFEDNPFVRDVAQLEQQLDKMVATGGGDEPETMLDALYTLLLQGDDTMEGEPESPKKWRYKRECSRIIIVFSDAPCHMKIAQAPHVDAISLARRLTDERFFIYLYAIGFKGYSQLATQPRFFYYPISTKKHADDLYPGVKALRDFTSDKEKFKDAIASLSKTVSEAIVAPIPF